MNKRVDTGKHGFTVVELIIVIVVVAILATIGVVAYNGLQQRGRNTARIATARTSLDSLKLTIFKNDLTTVKNSLNIEGGSRRACVGTGYTSGKCALYNGTAYAAESTAFNDLVRASADLPDYSRTPKSISTDKDEVRGPYVEERPDIGGKKILVMEFSLEGLNQDCVLRPLVRGTVIDSTYTYTSSGNGTTECHVVLYDNP